MFVSGVFVRSHLPMLESPKKNQDLQALELFHLGSSEASTYWSEGEMGAADKRGKENLTKDTLPKKLF